MSCKSQYPKISVEINNLARVDQDLREKIFSKNKGLHQSEKQKLDELDSSNSQSLKEIINNIGLPTITKVGRQASFNAWLIVQHSPDLQFQKEYLRLLKQNKNDVDKRNIAYLEDRILRREGKPQKYGTQVYFDPLSKKHKLQETNNLQELDLRRKRMGLEPIKNYLKRVDGLN